MKTTSPSRTLKLSRTNMKTTSLLLIIVGAGALTLGLGYAGEPSAPHENQTTNDRSAGTVRGQIQEHPKQVQKSHEGSVEKRDNFGQTKRASVNDLQQPGWKRAATFANDGLMMNKMEAHREEVARLPVDGGTTALATGVARSRSATTASVGGLAASSARNSAAAINGTGMNRRRY
jgi:hypothetical protein